MRYPFAFVLRTHGLFLIWTAITVTTVMNLFGCQDVLNQVKKASGDLTSNVNATNQSGKETQRHMSTAAYSLSDRGVASDSAYSFNTSSDAQVSELANGPFGGITIIEVKPNPNWERSSRFLVLFISLEGNYASLASLGFKAGCISWVIEHSSDFSSLTFGGSKANNSNPNIFNRSICPQFTVKSQGNETVRLVRGSSEITANIIARVPLQTPDWSMQIFDRYAIRGVRLGPTNTADVPPY